jgi:phage tail sheath protein FI
VKEISNDIETQYINRYWEYYTQVDGAPGRSTFVSVNGDIAAQTANTLAQQDELHVVVVDEDGGFTSSPGAVLEVFSGLSRATDAKLSDGTSNFYKNVINDNSNYIWAGADRTGAVSNTALNVVSSNSDAVPAPLTLSFLNGTDKDETDDVSTGVKFADLARAYDLFNTPEDADISLVITGKARGGANKEQLANYVIDNVAEVRKDCVVFVSPDYNDVVNNTLSAADDVVAFRNALRSTSFAVMDSGYKYQYDKYNDVYRYIPLNGDIAGLCVRTDATNDPWYSPAGTTRGQIRNSVRLAFNPNKSQRDLLYKNGVNPVISQQGQGTFLNGDKTLLAKPSAFDRINVRRLFIVLEKTIAVAAQSSMFEFNDEFTRAQFRNLVEPFLRDVQGRRGIYDFKVVCDATNNTPQVVDSNRFVGDIYVKPARSINYIQLNFVAVRSGIEFSEIVG